MSVVEALPAGPAPPQVDRLFSIEGHELAGALCVQLRGTVGAAAGDGLADLVRSKGRDDEVIIDISDCRLVDGAALQALVDIALQVRLRVVCPHSCIRGVLQFVGLDQLATIAEPTELC
jgi:anti-anti-sigma regulatory factor